jgi:hypothetical protein
MKMRENEHWNMMLNKSEARAEKAEADRGELLEAAKKTLAEYDQWVKDWEQILGKQPPTQFGENLRQVIARLTGETK